MAQSDLTVTMEWQNTFIQGVTQGFRILITASGDNIAPLPDNKIFLYTRTVPVPEDPTQVVDRFIAVCSPLDMNEYPADAPGVETNPPYFRLNQVDLIHTNKQVLLDTWNDIAADVQALADTLNAMNNLVAGETLNVGWTTG